jgi:N-acetylglutamate synthase-like GNAT family acetyltransferase
MSESELRQEIRDGVAFWGYERDGELAGVMGAQRSQDVTLIRHAYVRTVDQHQGIGERLLNHLRVQTSGPLLVGTWADAAWAVRFYEHRGFRLVSPEEKDRLLRRYWSVPERQIETSVVLAEAQTRETATAKQT